MAISSPGGANSSDSVLMPLPSLKHDTSSVPRMLTPSEIDWLRHNKKVMLDRLFAKAESIRTAPRRLTAA